MQPIMLARAAHAQVFTDIFNGIGSPIAFELERVGLPDLIEIQPDEYIPALPAMKFIRRIERKEGIDDVGFLASRQKLLDRLSGEFVSAYQSVPTLYARLQQFCLLAPLENSSSQVSLIREGSHIRVCNNLMDCSDKRGLRYAEWAQIAVLVGIIQKSVGHGWQPVEITFQSTFSPCESAFEQYPNSRFLFGQKNTSVLMPVQLISRHLQADSGKLPDMPASIPIFPTAPDFDFPASLQLALRTYLHEGYPDIKLAAKIASTSVRTLQRRLAKSGLSYTDLVQQTRFEVATEMFKDPKQKSLDVAHAVGYADQSHFARAFRRIAGVSPQEYRQQQNREHEKLVSDPN